METTTIVIPVCESPGIIRQLLSAGFDVFIRRRQLINEMSNKYGLRTDTYKSNIYVTTENIFNRKQAY